MAVVSVALGACTAANKSADGDGNIKADAASEQFHQLNVIFSSSCHFPRVMNHNKVV